MPIIFYNKTNRSIKKSFNKHTSLVHKEKILMYYCNHICIKNQLIIFLKPYNIPIFDHN